MRAEHKLYKNGADSFANATAIFQSRDCLEDPEGKTSKQLRHKPVTLPSVSKPQILDHLSKERKGKRREQNASFAHLYSIPKAPHSH